MRVYTTFPRGLKYSCDMEKCGGCCTLFEDIELYEDEIERLERLGYTNFYEKRSSGNYLKQPCPFLKGKLCRIHRKQGSEKKFSTCRKYPFSAALLKDERVVVDVKWSCPGVSLEDGREIDEKLLMEEFLEPEKLPHVPLGEKLYFHNPSRQEIEWMALERLYSSISRALTEGEMSIYRSILFLTGIARKVGSELGGKPLVTQEDVGQVAEFIKNSNREELVQQAAEATPVSIDFLGFSSSLSGIFEYEVNPQHALDRLGLEFGGGKSIKFDDNLEEIFSQPFSPEASRLLNHYLVQSLRESLTRPWDFISTYSWALGVTGLIDYLARLEAYHLDKEVRAEESRKAIMMADFLNKHFSSFREHAFQVYPTMGMQYLQFFITGIGSGLGGY